MNRIVTLFTGHTSFNKNQDENVNRFALSTMIGELLEREKEMVLGYYTRVTYYLYLRLRERQREKEREKKERDCKLSNLQRFATCKSKN